MSKEEEKLKVCEARVSVFISDLKERSQSLILDKDIAINLGREVFGEVFTSSFVQKNLMDGILNEQGLPESSRRFLADVLFHKNNEKWGKDVIDKCLFYNNKSSALYEALRKD